DLFILGQHRLVAVGPLRPLEEQSAVLAKLAQEPPGTRVVDTFGNLSMLVGIEPISAYRTLDLPALEPLTMLAHESLCADPAHSAVRKAMRACGVGVRVLDPISTAREKQSRQSSATRDQPAIDDPVLAGWLYERDWLALQGAWASRFRVLHTEPAPSRAWFLPL